MEYLLLNILNFNDSIDFYILLKELNHILLYCTIYYQYIKFLSLKIFFFFFFFFFFFTCIKLY